MELAIVTSVGKVFFHSSAQGHNVFNTLSCLLFFPLPIRQPGAILTWNRVGFFWGGEIVFYFEETKNPPSTSVPPTPRVFLSTGLKSTCLFINIIGIMKYVF